MIQKRQSAWNRGRIKNVIIASIILLVLIISVIVTNIVVGLIGEDDDGTVLPVVDTAIGESIYAGRPIAYETFDTDQVQEVDVIYFENDKDEGQLLRNYSIRRPSKYEEFEFYYTDTNGIATAYRPEMFYKDGTSYTDFYASDGSSGYSIYKITYLLVAISVLYFDEKMELPTDLDERGKMLDRYGLASDERQSIHLSYYKSQSAWTYFAESKPDNYYKLIETFGKNYVGYKEEDTDLYNGQFFDLSVKHILLTVDYDADGNPDDPEIFCSKANVTKEALETAIKETMTVIANEVHYLVSEKGYASLSEALDYILKVYYKNGTVNYDGSNWDAHPPFLTE